MAPKTVFWEVTNRCNLSCAHCYNAPFLNDERFRLSFDDGVAICDRLIAQGVTSVVFLGGEPFADPNLLGYIERLSDGGISSSISTNGTLVKPTHVAALARLNVRLVSVSLDGGVASLNDRIRGAGTFARIKKGLRTLADGRVNFRPRLAIACSLSTENSGEYHALFSLAADFGIVDIFINKYLPVSGTELIADTAEGFLSELDRLCGAAKAVGDFNLYLPTMPRATDYLGAKHGLVLQAKEQTCAAVDHALLLSDDGKVYPCSMARVEHQLFGTPYEGDFEAAIGSANMQYFVHMRAEKNTVTPNVCVNCIYQASCAKRCVLTTDQTKYYLICEALNALRTTAQTRR